MEATKVIYSGLDLVFDTIKEVSKGALTMLESEMAKRNDEEKAEFNNYMASEGLNEFQNMGSEFIMGVRQDYEILKQDIEVASKN